jgi:hypothetical protein
VTRSLIAFLGAAVLLATGAPSAQEPKASAPAVNAAAQSARSLDAKAQMEQMDAQMTKLRALQDKMVRATTPAERQKLMGEQHQAIHEGMGLITQMMGAMSGGTPLEQKAGTSDQDGPTQIMLKGIEMMALMTQIMREQLGLIAPPKGPASKPAK